MSMQIKRVAGEYSSTVMPQPKQRITEAYGPCWQCKGTGQVVMELSRQTSILCPRCSGTGQIVVRRTVEDV